MKTKVWQADWLYALVVVLLFVLFSQSSPLQSLERNAYDWGVQFAQRDANQDVAIIAIDEESITNIGRWPWSRDIHAELISKLTQAGAKVVVYAIFFAEDQVDPGLAYIQQMRQQIEASSLGALPELWPGVAQDVDQLRGDIALLYDAAEQRQRSFSADDGAAEHGDVIEPSLVVSPLPQVDTSVLDQIQGLVGEAVAPDAQGLVEMLKQAEQELNSDALLADAVAQSGKVILAQFFVPGEALGNPDSPLPPFVLSQAIPLENVADNVGAVGNGLTPLPVIQAVYPIQSLAVPAAGLGHLNADPDVDGAVRFEPLIVDYYGAFYPSLSLMAAAKSLNLNVDDMRVNLGESVSLGRLNVPTDSFLRMNTFFYADVEDRPAFSISSFFDVITEKINPEAFRDKIVLIGPTATGIGTTFATPISPTMAPVETLAHSVSSILEGHFFTEPGWGVWATVALYGVLALYLILLLPRLKAGAAAAITVLIVIAVAGAHVYLMVSETMWLKMAIPTAMLIVGHVILTTKRYLVTERGKERVETESAESNKMLALQFQGQGQLDMAFEKFQRIPIDDSIMGLLYNLALDFESKRKPAKARAVYEYMADHDKSFKDISDRIEAAKNMEATVILGGGTRGGSAAGTLILDGSAQKPTLGRYDVEKELGKGAMGVVYLGRDPKINREVAIKTMALSDEFEGEELAEAKSRFFREAESAGRLNHPNIVTIFDAGEEHDLAYIAMEFLRGEEMTKYTGDSLLPLDDALKVIADCADALDYAHQNNVVHRDIKPANVMYEEDARKAQITDFGIARVTDASKTKTGMVLGTPSYMSPEQLAGKKVDGRSDLFSLGVMMYQLLTGQLPFTGDSMATLMYKIANEAHPDILSIRGDLPECVVSCVNRALEKNHEQRYQRGADMAEDIRQCASSLDSGGAG